MGQSATIIAITAIQDKAPIDNKPTLRFNAPKGHAPYQAATQPFQNPSFSQNSANNPAYKGPKKFR